MKSIGTDKGRFVTDLLFCHFQREIYIDFQTSGWYFEIQDNLSGVTRWEIVHEGSGSNG